jgi:hypothetical protein
MCKKCTSLDNCLSCVYSCQNLLPPPKCYCDKGYYFNGKICEKNKLCDDKCEICDKKGCMQCIKNRALPLCKC